MDDETRGKPAKGNDWCPRGCQPLYELGECGMCGYEGEGICIDELYGVPDACQTSR